MAQSDQPLHAVWDYASNPTGAALLVELMAAANHRKNISAEIGVGGERVRRVQLQALSERYGDYGIADSDLPPAARQRLATRYHANERRLTVATSGLTTWSSNASRVNPASAMAW